MADIAGIIERRAVARVGSNDWIIAVGASGQGQACSASGPKGCKGRVNRITD